MLNKGQKLRKKKSPANASELNAWLKPLENPDDDVVDVESTEVHPNEADPGRNSAFLSARDRLQKITGDFRAFCQCTESDQQLELLGRMQEQIKAVRGVFLGAELSLWARFTSAISTFLFATAQKPGFLTVTSPGTIVNALDLLARVVVSGANWRGIDPGPITALILEQDERSRRALQTPLLGQGMKIADCENVQQAFEYLQDNAFDLIFVDEASLGAQASRFEPELRKLRYHPSTPIIITTGQSDLANQAANGACNFLAKPVAPTEVVVKALAFGLKHRVDSERGAPSPRRPAAIADRSPEAPAAEPSHAAEAPADSPSPTEVTAKPPARSSASVLQPVEPAGSRTLRARSALERTAELEKAQKNLTHDLAEALRRETQFKQQAAALERKTEALDQELAKVRQELSEQSERRLAFEQQATRTEEERSVLEKQLAKVRQELSRESQRRLAAEQQATRSGEDRTLLEKQLAARSLETQPAQKRAAELEKMQHGLQADLAGALQRETRLKQQCEEFEQELAAVNKTLRTELAGASQRENRLKQDCESYQKQLTSANQALEATRQELTHEQERRETAEESATELTGRVQELARKETALRQQLEAVVRDRVDEAERLQNALRKEVTARHQADKAVSELSADRTRLEKKLAESTAQSQKALERIAALEKSHKAAHAELEKKLTESLAQAHKALERVATLEKIQKAAQTELEEMIEQRRKLEQQSAALDAQMHNLSRTLKLKGT